MAAVADRVRRRVAAGHPTPQEEAARGYGKATGLLGVGVASTGLMTFAYFSVASHQLPAAEYARVSLLWSVSWIVVSCIYRPVEQLLTRSLAERRAHGHVDGHRLEVAVALQLGAALLFLAVALAARGPITTRLFGGSDVLFWLLVSCVLAYAAGFFARGWLAGHGRFGLYAGLTILEATARLGIALAAAVGLLQGQVPLAVGVAAAPAVSLLLVPAVLLTRRPPVGSPPGASAPVPPAPAGSAVTVADPEAVGAGAHAARPGNGSNGGAQAGDPLSLRHGAGFAVSVLGVMLAEQALLNAAPLAASSEGAAAALAGVIFNALLIARAPLQLFQAVQTSLLPHLARARAAGDAAAFRATLRRTLQTVTLFATAATLGLLAIGPPVMHALFGTEADYGRIGLAAVGLGMGLHLAAGTLTQAALARGLAGRAFGAWVLAAVVGIGWLAVLGLEGDGLLVAELGYLVSASVLFAALLVLELRSRRAAACASA